MKYLFETMIVYYLNPYYVLMSDTIFYGTKKIISLIVKPTELKVYLRLIGEIIASIANLFFLEILEFNCCGLNYSTKINIQKRSKLDCSCDIWDDNKYIFDFGTINSDYQSDADNQSNNPDELLKENSAIALGLIGDKKAIPYLREIINAQPEVIEVFNGKHYYGWLEKDIWSNFVKAICLLGRFKDEKSVLRLEEIANTKYCDELSSLRVNQFSKTALKRIKL